MTELNGRVRALLENQFEVLWVAGELSNVKKAASGHWYFSLKDARRAGRLRDVPQSRPASSISVPRMAMQVEVRARVTLYEPRGNYQLVVEEMRKAGLGALFEAFEKLKARLAGRRPVRARAQEGRCRPLPRAIGVVTSPDAAALRDVLTTLARRAPMVPVVLYPAQVQGEGAGAQLARAIETANARGECDVLIVCRGGGSLEDLWAFNEEVVARAIAASRLPVVSGVGHETDFSIADFVADLRAPTPTAAAVAASPDRAALRETVLDLRRRLARDLRAHRSRPARSGWTTPRAACSRPRSAWSAIASASRSSAPAALGGGGPVRRRALTLAALAPRLRRALPTWVVRARARGIAGASAPPWARARSARVGSPRCAMPWRTSIPTQVLARGYSIVRDADGHVRAHERGAGDGPAARPHVLRGRRRGDGARAASRGK